jgi:hypothetical protein
MLSGNIRGNKLTVPSGGQDPNPDVVFSSATGTITAAMNSSNKNMQIQINYPNADLYFASTSNNLIYDNFSVMMY